MILEINDLCSINTKNNCQFNKIFKLTKPFSDGDCDYKYVCEIHNEKFNSYQYIMGFISSNEFIPVLYFKPVGYRKIDIYITAYSNVWI